MFDASLAWTNAMLNAPQTDSFALPFLSRITHLQPSLCAVRLLCLGAGILRAGGLSANTLAFTTCHRDGNEEGRVWISKCMRRELMFEYVRVYATRKMWMDRKIRVKGGKMRVCFSSRRRQDL